MAMLGALGYNTSPWETVDAGFRLRQEIIFRGTGAVDQNLTFYGTITGCAVDKEYRFVYMVVPASHTNSCNPQDYALVLVPAAMVVRAEHERGDKIPIGRKLGRQNTCLRLAIDKREVMLDADDLPIYGYHVHFEVNEEEVCGPLREEDIGELIDATGPSST